MIAQWMFAGELAIGRRVSTLLDSLTVTLTAAVAPYRSVRTVDGLSIAPWTRQGFRIIATARH